MLLTFHGEELQKLKSRLDSSDRIIRGYAVYVYEKHNACLKEMHHELKLKFLSISASFNDTHNVNSQLLLDFVFNSNDAYREKHRKLIRTTLTFLDDAADAAMLVADIKKFAAISSSIEIKSADYDALFEILTSEQVTELNADHLKQDLLLFISQLRNKVV